MIAGGGVVGVAHADVDLHRVIVVTARRPGRAPAVARKQGAVLPRLSHQLQHAAREVVLAGVALLDQRRPGRHAEAAKEVVSVLDPGAAVAGHDARRVRAVTAAGRAAGVSRAGEEARRQIGVRLLHAAVDVGDDHAVAVEPHAGQPVQVPGEREVGGVHVVDVDLAAHFRARAAVGGQGLDRVDSRDARRPAESRLGDVRGDRDESIVEWLAAGEARAEAQEPVEGEPDVGAGVEQQLIALGEVALPRRRERAPLRQQAKLGLEVAGPADLGVGVAHPVEVLEIPPDDVGVGVDVLHDLQSGRRQIVEPALLGGAEVLDELQIRPDRLRVPAVAVARLVRQWIEGPTAEMKRVVIGGRQLLRGDPTAERERRRQHAMERESHGLSPGWEPIAGRHRNYGAFDDE